MVVRQRPIELAVDAGGGCLDIFTLLYLFSFLFPSLWETARYRLKYCLKGPLNQKQSTIQSPKVSQFSKLNPFFSKTVALFETKYFVKNFGSTEIIIYTNGFVT